MKDSRKHFQIRKPSFPSKTEVHMKPGPVSLLSNHFRLDVNTNLKFYEWNVQVWEENKQSQVPEDSVKLI